jgi:hypothetical protein
VLRPVRPHIRAEVTAAGTDHALTERPNNRFVGRLKGRTSPDDGGRAEYVHRIVALQFVEEAKQPLLGIRDRERMALVRETYHHHTTATG